MTDRIDLHGWPVPQITRTLLLVAIGTLAIAEGPAAPWAGGMGQLGEGRPIPGAPEPTLQLACASHQAQRSSSLHQISAGAGHVFRVQHCTRQGLAVPQSFSAQATGPAGGMTVSLSWQPGGGGSVAVDHYEVWRTTQTTAVLVAATTGTSATDSSVSQTTTYLYRVRAVDGTGGVSAFTPANLATTVAFTDQPLQGAPAGTPVKAVHVGQLQTAINAVRSCAGLPAVTWATTPAPGEVIAASPVQDLRTQLSPALAALGIPEPTYTNPTVAPGVVIRKDDIQQLRDVVN